MLLLQLSDMNDSEYDSSEDSYLSDSEQSGQSWETESEQELDR